MISIVLGSILLLAATGSAHLHPGMQALDQETCTSSIPPFQSYHIHTLFWQNNVNSTKAAERLQEHFMAEFGLTYEQNSCKVLESLLHCCSDQ